MHFSKYIKYYLSPITNILKTDNISFSVTSKLDYSEDPEGWEWKHTDIIINGISLFKRLYEYEKSEARRTKTDENLAGKYIGIDPYDLSKILNSVNRDGLSVWQCSICRSSLCSACLVCKYRVSLFYVEFYDFRQLAMPIPFNESRRSHQETIEKCKWNYGPFGPFKFNRFKFFRAFRSLAQRP